MYAINKAMKQVVNVILQMYISK